MSGCDDATRQRFTAEMVDRPRVWKQVTGLAHWSRFLQLVRNRGGVEAASLLIQKRDLSDGFIRLRDAGALNLTVEYLMLQTPFDCCFTSEERRLARVRLVENGMPRASLPLEPECH